MPKEGFEDALDHLRNIAVNAADPGEGAGEPLAYALYVLARNGRPVIGDLSYLADTKLDAFKTPLARAQLAAALAMLGDRSRASRVFGVALTTLEAAKDSRPLAARLRLEAARRGGRADAPRRGEARRRRGDHARERRRRRRARRDRLYVDAGERLARAWRRKRSPNMQPKNALTLDGKPVEGALYRRFVGLLRRRRSRDGRQQRRGAAQVGDDDFRRAARPRARPPPTAIRSSASSTRSTANKIDLKSITQNERVVVVLKLTEAGGRNTRSCWSSIACLRGSRSTIPRCLTPARPRRSPG